MRRDDKPDEISAVSTLTGVFLDLILPSGGARTDVGSTATRRNASSNACQGSLTFESIKSVHSFGLR